MSASSRSCFGLSRSAPKAKGPVSGRRLALEVSALLSGLVGFVFGAIDVVGTALDGVRPDLPLHPGPAGLFLLPLYLAYSMSAGRGRGKARQPIGAFLKDRRGTAALETVLLMPTLLLIVAVTVQVALMHVAHLVVNYAASCGARAAAVYVPLDFGPSERPNRIHPNRSGFLPGKSVTVGETNVTMAREVLNSLPGSFGGASKVLRIREAVAFACIPIASRISHFGSWAGVVPRVIGEFGGAFGRPVDQKRFLWELDPEKRKRETLSAAKLEADVNDRWAYARVLTGVVVTLDKGRRDVRVTGSTWDVRVDVSHMWRLAVPITNRILGKRLAPGVNGWFAPIRAVSVLPNEGHVLYPPGRR